MAIDLGHLDKARARAQDVLKRAPYRSLENWPEVRELAQSILDLADVVEALVELVPDESAEMGR